MRQALSATTKRKDGKCQVMYSYSSFKCPARSSHARSFGNGLKEWFGNEIKENGCKHYFESKKGSQPRVFRQSIIWKIRAKARKRRNERFSIIRFRYTRVPGRQRRKGRRHGGDAAGTEWTGRVRMARSVPMHANDVLEVFALRAGQPIRCRHSTRVPTAIQYRMHSRN